MCIQHALEWLDVARELSTERVTQISQRIKKTTSLVISSRDDVSGEITTFILTTSYLPFNYYDNYFIDKIGFVSAILIGTPNIW